MAFAGIVLAGGGARRLSGVDKPMLPIGGTPLLATALGALAGAREVVVVGPERTGLPELPALTWVRERPAGSGPVAALAAGLAALPAVEVTVVLAADLTGVSVSTVERLRGALAGPDRPEGAVLVDGDGYRQWLIGAWRTGSLRAVLPADPAGASLRATLGGLSIAEVRARQGECGDVDTPADLDRARRGGAGY
ncbi:molybdenum cofactor guanylyltransferase [Amycolatopsis aidingensis]|uniref:molybdenum cofactor guanylyltransferase n=1 Tax=Amycolatopsis aidingensis TaxID=2842453 RepID=UPI001C0ABC68|nr:NTP transferase domain-containing protein [Amycolatopsis aidingensis]